MRNSGLLSDCLVDSDADATRRAKQGRRKALTTSVIVECALLAALLIAPILMPGTMSAHYAVVPIPPYGNPHPSPPSTGSSKPESTTTHESVLSHQPRSIPTSTNLAPDASDDVPPSIGTGNADRNACVPGGSGVPGGSDTGPLLPRPPEPKPPVATKPLFVSQGAQEAMLIHRVEPVYPFIARQTHLSGTVELRAVIATDGSIMDLEIVSGNPILARAAFEAVRQWRYRPTLLNSQPIEVRTYVTVKFVLDH